MITKQLILANGNAASLESFIGSLRCTTLIIQAPSSNTNSIYIGDAAEQIIELYSSGASITLNVSALSAVYVKGTTDDIINILII